uniref:hypothetical protein n=1 Tax=Salmonella enterica TaxID=28901 RepID=UPI001C66AC8C|nr:hypothetical protein [Salmonella enterica]
MDPARTERPSGLANYSAVSRGEGNIPPLVSRCTAKEGAECLTESSCSGSERPDKREKYPFIPKPTSAFNVASTFLKHAKSVSYTAGWAR